MYASQVSGFIQEAVGEHETSGEKPRGWGGETAIETIGMIDLEDFKLIFGEIIIHTSKAPTQPGTAMEPARREPTHTEPPAGGRGAAPGSSGTGSLPLGLCSLKFREVPLLLHGIHHKMYF